MKRVRWNWQDLAGRIAAAAVAICAFATPPAQAGDVKLFVLAPQPPASLKTVETQGSDKPVYARSYNIPYNTVEQQIRNEIKKANVDVGGTVKCSGVCPDVSWHVSIINDFSFTQTSQPVVTAFGTAQDNGVDVSLQTQFNLHIVVSARLWADPVTGHVEGKADVPIDLLIGLKTHSKLGVWPEVKSISSYCEATKLQETSCVTLTLDKKNIDLSDPHGVAVAVGTALGGLLGASPLAAGIGDPLSGAIVGELISNEAAKIAEQKVQAEADKVLNTVLQIASIRATWIASNYVDAKVAQANNVKNKLLDTKLPGLNKSLQELAGAFGLSLDVQTKTPSGNVYVIVTPRFTANAGGGKIVGKLRMPKEACVYMRGPYGYLPMGFKQVNTDLAAKVGTSCASLLSATTGIKPSGYLGADPKLVKIGANPLPNWKPSGSASVTGNLSVVSHGKPVPPKEQPEGGLLPRTPTGYYECGFEVSGLPNAGIVELAFKDKVLERLTGFYKGPNRYVEVAISSYSAVLESDWKPAAPPLVVGGEGQCTSGKVIVSKYQARSWLDRMQDLFDPNKCPNCGIKLDEGVLEISNPEPVMQNPALKPMFEALQRGEPLPAAAKSPAAQGPATKQTPGSMGVQRAPALRPQLRRPGAQKEIPK